jgi:integrase
MARHGDGSLYRRPNNTWQASITIDGKRFTRTLPTRREAQEWLKTITGQVQRGLTYDSAKTTIDELFTTWLKLKATRTALSTQESYARIGRLYIRPGLGALKLGELTAAKVQAFYDDLQLKGIGKRTVEMVHIVLHGFLAHALRLGLVAVNWAELAEAPRPEAREMAVWDEAQVSQFLQFVNGDPFYRLAFSTGMRRGELIGLQWKDLDWRTSTIQVQRQVIEPEGGGWQFQKPKSERGRRAIRLGKGMIESLQNHYMVTIPQMRTIAGDRWKENDLIFPNTIGTPRKGYEVSKQFKELVILSGLPVIRFHDIRHTAASIMLAHGAEPVRVAAILGQSVQVLLSTYAHFLPFDQERTADLMDEITTPAMVDLSKSVHDFTPDLHQK